MANTSPRIVRVWVEGRNVHWHQDDGPEHWHFGTGQRQMTRLERTLWRLLNKKPKP